MEILKNILNWLMVNILPTVAAAFGSTLVSIGFSYLAFRQGKERKAADGTFIVSYPNGFIWAGLIAVAIVVVFPFCLMVYQDGWQNFKPAVLVFFIPMSLLCFSISLASIREYAIVSTSSIEMRYLLRPKKILYFNDISHFEMLSRWNTPALAIYKNGRRKPYIYIYDYMTNSYRLRCNIENKDV